MKNARVEDSIGLIPSNPQLLVLKSDIEFRNVVWLSLDDRAIKGYLMVEPKGCARKTVIYREYAYSGDIHSNSQLLSAPYAIIHGLRMMTLSKLTRSSAKSRPTQLTHKRLLLRSTDLFQNFWSSIEKLYT